jgi:hypothetical protein
MLFMQPSFIKLTYRHVIDISSADDFSRAALQFSHEEFKMKSHAYNGEGKFTTFSQLKENDGRANSLHYKCSFAIAGLAETLNKKIPFLSDKLGRSVDFDVFSFELIESDINDLQQHKAAVHFITEGFKVITVIGNHLVLAKEKAITDTVSGFTDLFTIKMQEGLAISAYK